MHNQFHHWHFFLIGAAIAGTTIFVSPGSAQLQPDSTLGSTVSTGNIINGGTTSGSNLFHSFSDFNVNTGQSVYFANPNGIENILSRVTGSNASNIDGVLGVNGAANLFLLNPNGIIFGENASLDISGSFTASTAKSLTFADGSEFQATPTTGELLTMSVPLGVQFNDRPQNNLTNDANLTVGNGATLTLFGKDVINSGNLTALGGTVQVLGDRLAITDQATIDVSSATGNGQVFIGGNYQGQGELPNATSTFVGNDVVINANALTNGNGGQVIVWADGGTRFLGDIYAQGGSVSGNGGFVEVSGKQQLDFRGNVDTSAAIGSSGTLLLDPDNITVIDGNTLPADAADGLWAFSENPGDQTIGAGAIATLLDSNSLTLQANNKITVNGDISAFSNNDLTFEASQIEVNNNLRQFGGGNISLITPQLNGNFVTVNAGGIVTDTTSNVKGGDIRIMTHDFTIRDGAVLFAGTIGSSAGNSGKVVIHASGNVLVTGGSVIDSQVLNSSGNSGGVEIRANSLTIEGLAAGAGIEGDRSSRITTRTNSSGNAGDITLQIIDLNVRNGGKITAFSSNSGKGGIVGINFSNQLQIDGGEIEVSSTGSGDVGELSISAEDTNPNTPKIVSITNNGKISATNVSADISGEIFIEGITALNITNGGIINAETTGAGAGGGIEIKTSELNLTNGGSIKASTSGSGLGGLIEIISPRLNLINALGIEASTTSSGQGGDIEIQTSEINFANGGEIAASTSGSGNGGSLELRGDPSLTLRGPGRITVESENFASGRAGTLNIGRVSVLALRDGITLSATSASSSGGGNVDIAVDNHVFFTGGSLINASSSNAAAGDGGNVTIRLGNGFLIGRSGQNNDITANAVGGNGGNISINALQIFGFAQQSSSTLTALRSNETNDISASSEFGLNGNVILSTLDLDPSQGLTELPTTLGDRSNQLTASCDVGSEDQASEFVVTGRGGLPPSSTTLINARGVSIPWVIDANDAPIALTNQASQTTSANLVEAQEVAMDAAGNLYFVADSGIFSSSKLQATSSEFCHTARQL